MKIMSYLCRTERQVLIKAYAGIFRSMQTVYKNRTDLSLVSI